MQTAEKKELEDLKSNLKKRLNEVERKLDEIFITENKPLLEKKYNDTYWTHKNSYSCDSKEWTVYVHAKTVDSIWDCAPNGINAYIISDTFEFTSDNKLLIEFDKNEYPRMLEKKVTKKEFENAILKMLLKVEGVSYKVLG